MDDLISRQAAIDVVKHAWGKGLEPTQYLEELPSAQPEVVKCKKCRYVYYDKEFDNYGENNMDKNKVLKILETAKDENGEVPMRLVRQAFEKLPEPCEDAVSRADMLETYADLYDVFEDNDQIRKELNKVYDKLNALPPVTPKRKTGKWIKRDVSRQIHGISCSVPNYQCSVCKKWWFHNGEGLKWYKFCPECGADMRGE